MKAQFLAAFSKTNNKAIRTERTTGSTVVIFVHGLSGSALGTWKPMVSLLQDDEELSGISYGCYSYPTKLIRVPFTGRMASIREIANGLRTYIETIFGDDKEIVLVGHSLGGLVARQYVLDEVKAARGKNLAALGLFATPHTGAALANIGNSISWRHRHLKELCKGSELLESINTDWVTLKIEQNIKTVYVVGGCDAVVPRDSGSPYIGADNVRTLINCGHVDIIKPKDVQDLRYKFLKEFLRKSIELPSGCNASSQPNPIPTARNTEEPVDILFDIYKTGVEPYYVKRNFDKVLFEATRNAHAWVSGEPGIGKTASLVRLASVAQWRLEQILLDSFQGLDALGLFREIVRALCERAGLEDKPIPKDADLQYLAGPFKSALAVLGNEGTVALLIEEIPLPEGKEYSLFLKNAFQVAQFCQGLAQTKVVLLFSSVRNPRPDLKDNIGKFLERFQLINAKQWEIPETKALIDLLSNSTGIELDEAKRESVITSSHGSPRFVKMVFRRMRNEATKTIPFAELLASVAKDLAYE